MSTDARKATLGSRRGRPQSGARSGKPGEQIKVIADVTLRIEGGGGMGAGAFGAGRAVRTHRARQPLDRGSEAGVVASRKHEAGVAWHEAFANPLCLKDDGGEAVGLGFDHEIREGLGSGGMHRNVRSQVKWAGVPLPAKEPHPRSETP